MLIEAPDEFDKMLDVLVDAFVEWRTGFFSAQFGEEYLTLRAGRDADDYAPRMTVSTGPRLP